MCDRKFVCDVYEFLLSRTFFCNVVTEETEYEYSGSDEEEENRGDDRESR